MSPEAVAPAGHHDGTEDTLVPPPPPGLDKTAAPQSQTATLVPAAAVRTTQARTTVLPSFDGAQVAHPERDRYKVVKVLGAGGMGEVSLAQDQDIDRSVAVKYLHPNLADAGMLARFVEEIRTVGHLEHPNIVPIHDVGLDEQGRYFFVMKHLDGETLETIIEKLRARDPVYEERYGFERRAEIIIGVLRALQFAHLKGIIHRDIKPANIMVGKHGEVVVMDWGIAKSIGSKEISIGVAAPPPPERMVQTQVGSLLGTPLYMAPEQAAAKPETMDARSDLYSVAVVLYELMSLEHYLGEPKDMATLLAGIGTTLPSHNPGDYTRFQIPPMGYIHAVRQGLQADPAERYQTAEEFIDRLGRILGGRGQVCCPITATRRVTGEAGRFVDRYPRIGATLGVGLPLFFLATTVISIIALAGGFRS